MAIEAQACGRPVIALAGSGALETLPGRVAAVALAFAWEKAVALTPRPFEARTRLKSILLKTLKSELRAEQGRVDPEQAERIKTALPDDVESHIYFPNRIRAAGRSIRFTVPDTFLGGPAQPTWGYVVVVTGADIDLRFDTSAIAGGVTRKVHDNLMVLPLSPGGREDHFGGAQEDDHLQPPILDLIVPLGFTPAAHPARLRPAHRPPGRAAGRGAGGGGGEVERAARRL